MPGLQALALAACEAADEGRPFRVLTPEQAREIEAVAEQILPTDDTPGARDAAVVRFIDLALEGFARADRGTLIEGLDELATAVRRRHGDGTAFSELRFEDQTAVLREIEETAFFGTVRALTLLGMFSHPRHGGNRDRAGWRLLGFEDRGAYQPPFGWYDERVATEGGPPSASVDDEPSG